MRNLSSTVLEVYRTAYDIPALGVELGIIYSGSRASHAERERITIRKAIDKGRIDELYEAAKKQKAFTLI